MAAALEVISAVDPDIFPHARADFVSSCTLTRTNTRDYNCTLVNTLYILFHWV